MWHRVLVALLAAWAGLSVPAASAETVFPPGLRIGLEPQANLTVSKTFPGFEDADRKVAVSILDLPARAYEEIERSAFGPEQTGLTNVKRESFPFASGIGFLISGTSQDNGVIVHKWFLLATAVGGEVKDLATLINVQVPAAARTVYTDEVVRKTLVSVTFRPAPLKEQLAMLPFQFSELAGFRVMQVLPQGGVILIDGPVDDMTKNTYVIVSIGRGAPETPDERGKFARELLTSAPLRDLTVTSGEAMRIAGSQGFEIRAQAKGLAGEPVTLVQWVRYGSGGFLRIIGVGNASGWDTMFTRLRALRDGIETR